MTLHLGPVPSDPKRDARISVMDLLAQMQQAAKSHHIIEHQRLSDELHTLTMAYMAPTVPDPLPKVRLTPSEGRLLSLFRAHVGKTVSTDMMMNALYFDKPGDQPDDKICDIFICKLRKKLKEITTDFSLETVWGQGYRMVVK